MGVGDIAGGGMIDTVGGLVTEVVVVMVMTFCGVCVFCS